MTHFISQLIYYFRKGYTLRNARREAMRDFEWTPIRIALSLAYLAAFVTLLLVI